MLQKRPIKRSVGHCFECDRKMQKLELCAHVYIHWRGRSCEDCSGRFRTLRAYFAHLPCSTYTCDECAMCYRQKAAMSTHIHKLHMTGGVVREMMECFDCGDVLSTRLRLQKHGCYDQFRSTAQCFDCGTTVKLELMTRHVTRAHMVGFRMVYQCFECGERFWPRTKLLEHLLQTHFAGMRTIRDRVACYDCSNQYKKKVGLINHFAIFHRMEWMKYFCAKCDAQFVCKDALNFHYDAIHLNLRQYECAVCDKSFRWKQGLHGHLKAIHQAFGRQVYICAKCGYSNIKKQHLQEHLMIRGCK